MPKHILIVEDDAVLRSLLQRLLDREGFIVSAAEDLATGRALMARVSPNIILLDLQLPDGYGLDLLKELTSSSPVSDVIVMTGMGDLSVAVEAMQRGAYDFLSKPFEREVILALVRRCLSDQEERTRAGPATSTEITGPAGRLMGSDPAMLDVFKLMGMATTSRSQVLIRGDSGTGKELVARTIHQHQMPDLPFVGVNCAALPDALLESELFGHEKGAFTGAGTARRGALELAGEGTLLLDEIGDTSPAFQTKLLRVLQEQEFWPLGSERPRPLRARVMAATHRPLEEMTESGAFRQDLYFRLRVLEISLPPLSERQQDIPRLALHLLRMAAQRLEKPAHRIPPDVMHALMAHSWPGNVRELENAMTRAVAMSRGPEVTLEALALTDHPGNGNGFRSPEGTSAVPASGEPDPVAEVSDELEAMTYAHACSVLQAADGNKRETARRLGISPSRLYRILSEGE